jgi:hypothetical protein
MSSRFQEKGSTLPNEPPTREVMRAGADVIYQAAVVVPPWLGIADFLERISEESGFGR